jgi:hypothetical protein
VQLLTIRSQEDEPVNLSRSDLLTIAVLLVALALMAA